MNYYVKYKMYSVGEVKGVCAPAKSKEAAYELAVYEIIKNKEGELPYCAWVDSVTYNNGRVHRFNTFEGNPY